MNTQNILTRVKLKHVKGAEIAYIYNLEFLKNLNQSLSEINFSERYLNIGDGIIYENKKFKIIEIHSKFFNETEDLSNGKGINLLGTGEQLPYNFQITYILDDYN